MSKITWDDKVTLIDQPDVARINKVIDDDMNEIKSVVNDNDDSLSDITGTILWTNPNPTSDFSAQSVTLSSSNYDILEIFYSSQNDGVICNSVRSIKGKDCVLMSMQPTASVTPFRVRKCNYVSATSLSFDASYYGTNDLSNTSNTYCIPQYVIGYKTGLFNV